MKYYVESFLSYLYKKVIVSRAGHDILHYFTVKGTNINKKLGRWDNICIFVQYTGLCLTAVTTCSKISSLISEIRFLTVSLDKDITCNVFAGCSPRINFVASRIQGLISSSPML